MSYDIFLCDPVSNDVLYLEHPHFMRGGTYAMNGTTKLWLNVTYNYSIHYYKPEVFGAKGIRSIYGLSGAESIPVLEKAISALGNDVVGDYWQPTEGNSKRPLFQLLAMARMRPDGIWKGD